MVPCGGQITLGTSTTYLSIDVLKMLKVIVKSLRIRPWVARDGGSRRGVVLVGLSGQREFR